jgi:hypothetical protein
LYWWEGNYAKTTEGIGPETAPALNRVRCGGPSQHTGWQTAHSGYLVRNRLYAGKT